MFPWGSSCDGACHLSILHSVSPLREAFLQANLILKAASSINMSAHHNSGRGRTVILATTADEASELGAPARPVSSLLSKTSDTVYDQITDAFRISLLIAER